MCRKKMQKKNRKARHWHMKEAQKKTKWRLIFMVKRGFYEYINEIKL